MHVVELWLHGPQAGFNIAQAFAAGDLGEGHGQELVLAGKAVRVAVAAVAGHAPPEFMLREEVHQLGKDRPARVQGRALQNFGALKN